MPFANAITGAATHGFLVQAGDQIGHPDEILQRKDGRAFFAKTHMFNILEARGAP